MRVSYFLAELMSGSGAKLSISTRKIENHN